MKTRIVTKAHRLRTSYRREYVPIPKILLAGNYLQQNGFEIGRPYKIICKNGQITISLV